MRFFAVFLFVVAAITVQSHASAAACPPGYVTSSSDVCVPASIPNNAHLNTRGTDWTCDFGYERHGHKCGPVVVPRNATLGRNSDVWRCNFGYYEKWGVCLPKEGADLARKAPLDFKALREEARRRYAAPGASVEGRDGALALFIALAVAATVLLLIGRREPVVTAYTPPTPHSFRPHRPIAASADAWLSWGERIDGLTGGPVAEGVPVTQCPTCQTCYGAESIAVLRRENNARCLACGSRILRQPTRARFETVLDKGAIPAR